MYHTHHTRTTREYARARASERSGPNSKRAGPPTLNVEFRFGACDEARHVSRNDRERLLEPRFGLLIVLRKRKRKRKRKTQHQTRYDQT